MKAKTSRVNWVIFYAGTALCLVATYRARDSWAMWAVVGVFWMASAAWYRAGGR